MPECTFATLRDVLLGLGFSMRSADGAVIFEHPPASARLIMEPFGDAETVDAATLVVVRRNLDERGILPRARFDDLLRQRSLVG
jgi:hypothetical protein